MAISVSRGNEMTRRATFRHHCWPEIEPIGVGRVRSILESGRHRQSDRGPLRAQKQTQANDREFAMPQPTAPTAESALAPDHIEATLNYIVDDGTAASFGQII